MDTFAIYDVVRLKRPIQGVSGHQRGTILLVHTSGCDFEVEFFDEDFVHHALLTVNACDICHDRDETRTLG
jgi:hypothetical protein